MSQIHLHLACKVLSGRVADFLAFIREAKPFYESPGGIQVFLLEDLEDDHRFIEVVIYQHQSAYEQDKKRVEEDIEMKEYLARWRALLAEPPHVSVYVMKRVGC